MRTAQKRKGSRSQVSSVASLPSPVHGWNARDALGAMKPTEAVFMENYFPAATDVMIRKGYTSHATGFPSTVESLMQYSSGTTNKLFGVSDGKIYDCTASGAIGAAAVSSMSNSRFQHINVSTAGGSFLLAVNGANKMRIYTGSAWDYDGGGTYTVTGVDTANCINIALHKNRVWLIQKSTLKAWYLPTSSIAGAASALDFSSVARMGGYLVAMGTWTIDAGYGVDDHAVFVTSNGEIIVYKGTDPSSATTWALVGVWQVGSPVGYRCLTKYAGDLLVVCQDGLMPLSGALQSSRLNPRVALTDVIQYATSDAISTYGTSYGWQVLVYPKANQLYLNVPSTNKSQFVMNTITKAWCKFTGQEATCWELFNDEPYFGGSTAVYRAWFGTSDNGSNINSDCLQAFNYFGSPGTLKKFGMSRPIFSASGSPSILAGINVDFDQSNTYSLISYSGTTSAKWGTAKWGAGAWGSSEMIFRQWQTVKGLGYSAGVRMKVAAKDISINWISTDLTMESGAVL